MEASGQSKNQTNQQTDKKSKKARHREKSYQGSPIKKKTPTDKKKNKTKHQENKQTKRKPQRLSHLKQERIKHKASYHWERFSQPSFFSFVSKEFFIRLNLSLEFEILHSPLVSTPIKKQCIHVYSLASGGSVYSPLAVDTMPGEPDSGWKRIKKKNLSNAKKKQQHQQQQQQKKHYHMILFCTLRFVLLRKAAWFYPAARIHYCDL